MRRILNITMLCLLASYGLKAQVWSPDGKKIAFFYIHSIEDIYLVDADGSNFKILEGHPERDFSPNGHRMAGSLFLPPSGTGTTRFTVLTPGVKS